MRMQRIDFDLNLNSYTWQEESTRNTGPKSATTTHSHQQDGKNRPSFQSKCRAWLNEWNVLKNFTRMNFRLITPLFKLHVASRVDKCHFRFSLLSYRIEKRLNYIVVHFFFSIYPTQLHAAGEYFFPLHFSSDNCFLKYHTTEKKF